jgi:hypothetical protein
MFLDKVDIAIYKERVHVELDDDFAAELELRGNRDIRAILRIPRILEVVYNTQQNSLNAMDTQNDPLSQRVTPQTLQVLAVTIRVDYQSYAVHLEDH